MRHYPYEYLQDTDFLKRLYEYPIQTQYCKITILDWKERPLQEIQGRVTGGNINLDGNSAMRRSCNLSAYIDKKTASVTIVNNLFALNKKMYLEIGLENKTEEYPQYPICWFPQGVFVMTSVSLSHNDGGSNINLGLKDKMCLLNGEVSGTIPTTVQFDQYDTVDIHQNWVTSRPTIIQIIRELVNHWGGEQHGKIYVNDLDTKVKQVQKWLGNQPVYLIHKGENLTLTTNYSKTQDSDSFTEYTYGDDIGYILTDFTYPGELVSNVGDSVCTILDKIKNTLGNYEYYYDIDGNFIWQEIKNYLNTTKARQYEKDFLNNLYNHGQYYLLDNSKSKQAFEFDNSNLITSFQNTPQYNMISNDFVVWGIKKTATGAEIPMRYHLAIDTKPKIGNTYRVFIFEDPTDGLTKLIKPLAFDSKGDFPKVGELAQYYLDSSTQLVYIWDNEKEEYVAPNGLQYSIWDSESDFPTYGEETLVYYDNNTHTKYEWALNIGSQHYKEIEAHKNNLKLEYQNNLKDYNDKLERLENQKAVQQQAYVEAQNAYRDAEATVHAAESAKNQAEINKQLSAQNLAEEQEIKTQLQSSVETCENAIKENGKAWTDPLKAHYGTTKGWRDRYGLGKVDLYSTERGRTQITNSQSSICHDGINRPYYTSVFASTIAYVEQGGKFISCIGVETSPDGIKPITTNGNIKTWHAAHTADTLTKNTTHFSSVSAVKTYNKYVEMQQAFLFASQTVQINGENKNLPRAEIMALLPSIKEQSKIQNQRVIDFTTIDNNNQTALNKATQTLNVARDKMSQCQTAAEEALRNLQNTEQEIERLKEEFNSDLVDYNNAMGQANKDQYEYCELKLAEMIDYTTNDWRTELYIQGVNADPLGLDSNYYYLELMNEWPKIFDFRNNKIYDEVNQDFTSLDYYLDFIDSGAAIGALNVEAIGRRTKVITDNTVNCVFEPQFEDIVIIETNQDDTAEKVQECKDRDQVYTQVDSNTFSYITAGGTYNSAFEVVKDLLYQYTSYNESISLQTLPLFHLEPNIRIAVHDIETDIHGDYIVSSISIPLTIDGQMSINATRALEKI